MANRHPQRKHAQPETETETLSKSVEALAGSVVPPEALDAMTRLACTQYESCLHAFGALFRAAEAIRGMQLDAARSARRTHEAALAKLAEARTPADLLGVTSELMRFDTDGSMRYWQSLNDVMARMQAELLEAGSRDMSAVTDRAMHAISAAAAPAEGERGPGLGTDFAALMARLTKPSAGASADAATEAWQRWMKLSEDWTRLALQPHSTEGTATH